jgi:hypothetical protein
MPSQVYHHTNQTIVGHYVVKYLDGENDKKNELGIFPLLVVQHVRWIHGLISPLTHVVNVGIL